MSDLSSAAKEKIKMEETLTTRYQTEKDSIKQILTEEFNEKISIERDQYSLKLKEITEELQNEHDNKHSTLKEQLLHEQVI
jgi:LPS O-antigen subunit length determinant protein (WzzB/FepE family)